MIRLTPEEKAQELVNKYYHLFSVELENTIDYREAKQCALILVDEIINTLIIDPIRVNNKYQTTNYWQDVKKEIKKL